MLPIHNIDSLTTVDDLIALQIKSGEGEPPHADILDTTWFLGRYGNGAFAEPVPRMPSPLDC